MTFPQIINELQARVQHYVGWGRNEHNSGHTNGGDAFMQKASGYAKAREAIIEVMMPGQTYTRVMPPPFNSIEWFCATCEDFFYGQRCAKCKFEFVPIERACTSR